ncbi:sensor histidine kinase [Jiella sp. M17.18]|uniref:sensor histidine kinase n=1 Tax=Jiella sp. M17.18 TaxID=3234247 RepID=UPI0034DE68E7
MRRADVLDKITIRWSAGIAAALALQAILLSALFWWQTVSAGQADLGRELSEDCAALSRLSADRLADAIGDRVNGDLHRTGFIGLFDRDGRPTMGNILTPPPELRAGTGPHRVTLRRADPAGVAPDEAEAVACRTAGGDLLVIGRDLDFYQMIQHLVWRALMLSILPAAALAVLGGIVLARRGQARVRRFRFHLDEITDGGLKARLPVRGGEDEFDLISAGVNQMLGRIETLMAELRGVGDDIAHELRTPLTRLRAKLERGGDAVSSPEDVRLLVDGAISDIDQALHVIGALLRIRAIEQGVRRGNFEPVDLGSVLRTAVELYQPIAESKGVALSERIAPDRIVRGDPDLLMEALANLLDNAVKFTPAGGSVRAELAETPSGLRVLVSDDGPGIDPGEREAVFRRFHRSRARDAPGHGLGLSLVAAIAHLHGFAVSIQPSERGCSIAIDCPAAT